LVISISFLDFPLGYLFLVSLIIQITQKYQKSQFHQIIHPISLNHTPISIRSVTIGIRATDLVRLYTTKHLRIQEDEIRSLPFRTSTFAKTVVPQSSSSFNGLSQQYKVLLTRRTYNQCASRKGTHRPIPGGNTNHATELHRARITTESRRRGPDFLPRRALLVCGDRELSRHTRRLGLVATKQETNRARGDDNEKLLC
jgi:hypothetical protein